MTTRLLPRWDWPRLVGTELESLIKTLPPGAQVVVVEDARGAIVGCWAAFPVLHVEGVWMAPAHRGKSAVARRLWRAMGDTVRQVFGTTTAVTGAVTPEVTALLTKHATPLPGTHFLLSWES